MYNKALALIEKYDTIIIHRHGNPDGDAIGSQVGLKNLLSHNYPNKKILLVGDDAKRYGFVEGWQPNNVADSDYSNALAIVLDTSAKHMISDNRYPLAAATLRFDHHIFVEQICNVEVVDTTFESCCGLITHFARECGWAFTPAAAKALFTGMVTDSGRFRYDSTNARTFELASLLVQQPFDTNDIYRELYADDLAMLQLRAKYTLKIQTTPCGVAYIRTTLEELVASGADSFTISRAMVGVMSDIKGVHSWVNFTQTEKGILCELRSKQHNINPIAVKYGGGGHAKASGATVADWQTADQMLADLNALQGE